jgi:prepilin-type N-terminal cleavage/methylation domain-containing protein
MKTKIKILGFTLIELLVVIVIIGILSTISTATFKSYFGKARDAERTSAIQNIALMIKVDGADDWDNTKYMYDVTTLKALFDVNDFRVPKATNNIPYYIAMTNNGATGVGDDNEFVIATWGESTSTANQKTAGVIADGTQKAVDNVDGLTKTVFLAPNIAMPAAFKTAFMTGLTSGTQTYLKINASGDVVLSTSTL